MNANTSLEISYTNCHFIGNTFVGGALIVLAAGPPAKLVISGCDFDNSGNERPYDDQMDSLVLVQSSTSTMEIQLLSSSFIGLRTTGNMIRTAAPNLLDASPFAETLSIQECYFAQCASSNIDAVFMYINAGSFSLIENTYSFASEFHGQMPVAVHLHDKNSRIENTQFTIGNRALYPGVMSLSCDDGTSIEFYNCCFTKSQSFQDDYPLYLDISGAGASVVFSAVCFDAESQDLAVRNDGATVQYLGSSFGDCQCWELAYSESPSVPSSEVVTTSAQTESSESSFTSSSFVPGTTDHPDSGSESGNASTGLIVGIVVALVVILIIIVIIIILLLRRKGQKDTEEEVQAAEEFTEETITTLGDQQTTDDLGDWKGSTEDNPLFATENFDNDDVFGNSFEEQGFFKDA